MKYLPLHSGKNGHGSYQQQVKESNIKQIFDLIRSGKCKSRAEIVRYMNLSATSVSVLVEELAARGLITETGPKQTSQPGRRPISLRLNSDAQQMAVFVVQRDGVRYSLLDLECRVLETRFHALDCAELSPESAGDRYAAVFEEILNHGAEGFDQSRALMVGIALPGAYDPYEQLFLTEPALGVSIPEEAMRRLQKRVHLPVYMFNTILSMAYAEKKMWDTLNPEAAETRDMIFVEISDGIGCALISGGNLYTGPYNTAGAIGHFTIDYNGRPCRCGSQGCLERYVNLNDILSDAQQACREAGVQPPETLEALAERYPAEPVLTASVGHSARLLAFGLYDILCSSGLRRIVLGGGIELLGEPFLQAIYRQLKSRTMLIRHLELSYARAGSNAGSIGIAQHFLDKVYTITA